MFYVFLAEGFEETEALAPVDVMRRAKLDVKTVGVTGECVTSSHGVPVKADITIDNIDLDDVQGVVLPGGMPGTLNLEANKKVIEAVDEAGVKLQIGFNRRYDHNFAEIKNLENK